MFLKRKVGYSVCKQKMMSFRGQGCRAKMTSLGGNLIALVYHTTKKVNKAEELNYLYINIGNPVKVTT